MTLTLTGRSASTPSITVEEFEMPPNFAVPSHHHSPAHVLVMLAGSLTERNVSGSSYCGPRSIRYSPGGDRHERVLIGPEGAHCLVIEAPGFPELRLVERIAIPADSVLDRVNALDHCLFAERCVSPAAVEECALDLFTFVRERARPARVQHHHWIARVRDYLRDCVGTRAPLTDAAHHVGRNRSAVARVFRASYGISVHRYYRRRQIDRAWSLMAEASLSLSGIALSCGFTDQSHMTRAFVRESDLTPARVQERMRRGDENAHHWYRSMAVTLDH